MFKLGKEMLLKGEAILEDTPRYLVVQSGFHTHLRGRILPALNETDVVIESLVMHPTPVECQPGTDRSHMIENVRILHDPHRFAELVRQLPLIMVLDDIANGIEFTRRT